VKTPVALLRAVVVAAECTTNEERAAAIARGAHLATGSAATTILFGGDRAAEASEPAVGVFALRDGSPEVCRLLLHALGRFAVPGAFFVPHGAARALAGVASSPPADDLLFVPIVAVDATVGMVAIACESPPTDEAVAELRSFADAIGCIVGADRSVAVSRRESRDSRALAIVNERMRRSLGRADTLNAIVEAVREGFSAKRCAIIERSTDDEKAVVLASADDGTLPPMPGTLPIDYDLQRVFGGAASNAGGPRSSLSIALGVRNAAVVPLARDGRFERALAVGFAIDDTIDEGDVAALRTVAMHAGLALANARLYEREVGRRARAEALERVVRILRDTQTLDEVLLVFVVAVTHELPLDCAAHAIEGDAVVRHALRMRTTSDPSPSERLALDELAPFLAADEPTDSALLPRELRSQIFRDRSGMIVPLRVEGSLWGMLTILNDAPTSEWPADDRTTFFRTLGSHLELALVNALAFERELRQAQERATLAEAARTILSYTSLQPLADAMCRLAANLISAERVCAVRVEDTGLEPIGSFGEDAVALVEKLPARPSDDSSSRIENERRRMRVTDGPGYAAIPLDLTSGESSDQGSVEAFLIVGKKAGERFERGALRLLQELGALFALALRNLELYEVIVRANAALRESSGFKDDLIAMLAHDFKGPLTVVLGYCELLLESAIEGRDEIETIFAQTQRLVRLSEDALVLAKTQAEGFSLDRAIVNFGDFVAASVDSISRTSGRVSLHAGGDALPVALDPQRFSHVIDNLLSNALKYSTAEVSVTVRREGDRVLFEVSDRGIGIPVEESEAIFTRFGRASNVRKQGVPGSGVGLYVARKIVEVHRGTIGVRSAENEGSTFTVSLPIAEAVQLPAAENVRTRYGFPQDPI
jgi:signal transduction histidine kinase